MKYTSLLLLSVLSVLFVPIIQNAHAQNNPLDQLIGGIKNLTSGAGKASNNTASQAGQSAQNATSQAGQSAQNATSQAGQSAQKAGQSAQKAGQSFQDINRNAASYPGNASDAGNNNISKNNPIGGALQNATKGIGDTVGKLLNMGNNTAK